MKIKRIVGIIGIVLTLLVFFVSLKINDLYSKVLVIAIHETRFMSKDDDVNLLALLVKAKIYPEDSEFQLLPTAYMANLLLKGEFFEYSEEEQEKKLSKVKILDDYELLVNSFKVEDIKIADENITKTIDSLDFYKALQIAFIILIAITQIILLHNSKKVQYTK